MVSSAVVSEMALHAGKNIAEEGVKGISQRMHTLERELNGEFRVLNEEVTIICPENIQKCSMIFESRKGKLFNNCKKIPGGNIRRATIRAIHSLENYNSSICYLEDGFKIHLDRLPPDDTYILDIDYVIDDANFLDSFITRHKSDDVPFKEVQSDGVREYWMHAEMKHPQILKQKYGKFDFQDVDFKVDVAIHQDVKTEIDPRFKDQITKLCDIAQETNPRAMMRRGYAYINSKKYSRKKINDTLADLQDLFTPKMFKSFIDVKDDFHYGTCERGLNYHENIPIPTWPKTMNVTSRTDLSLECPAANGALIYNRRKFIDEIIKITGI
jgi:hypothetical protein